MNQIDSNDKLFFNDFVSKGWTKEELSLNLIITGTIVSAAYVIGSAYLSSDDRINKISKEFFKSLPETTFKKISECSFVPILFKGPIKIIYLLINICWNQIFSSSNRRPKESPNIEPQAVDLAEMILSVSKAIEPEEMIFSDAQPIEPEEMILFDPFKMIESDVIVNHIFSHLNLHELGVSMRVSNIWKEFARTPILWQSVIYSEMAFTSKNWIAWDEKKDLLKDIEIALTDEEVKKERLSLPQKIREELRLSAFAGKRISETHVLVRILKGLTIKKLGNFAKQHFKSTIHGYKIHSNIVQCAGDNAIEESYWLLMTKDVLPESRGKSFSEQLDILKELSNATGVSYKAPTSLEAATCILAEFSRSISLQFSNDPWTFTRCDDNFPGYQSLVGGFNKEGLLMKRVEQAKDYSLDGRGVAVVRKL